jgi:LacI family transcriptional regulator
MLVITKARELGYYQYSTGGEATERGIGNVALLTQQKLLSHSFGAQFLTSFTERISRSGYTMQMYEMSAEELASRKLPSILDLEQTAGFLGIELFDRDYIDMVCTLDKPTVFVDGNPRAARSQIACDFISMENITSETEIVDSMIEGGARRLGFVGDIEHCNSFYERWVGFCAALGTAGITVDRSLCILADDSEPYGDV